MKYLGRLRGKFGDENVTPSDLLTLPDWTPTRNNVERRDPRPGPQGCLGSTLLHAEAVAYLQTIVMTSDIGKHLLSGALK